MWPLVSCDSPILCVCMCLSRNTCTRAVLCVTGLVPRHTHKSGNETITWHQRPHPQIGTWLRNMFTKIRPPGSFPHSWNSWCDLSDGCPEIKNCIIWGAARTVPFIELSLLERVLIREVSLYTATTESVSWDTAVLQHAGLTVLPQLRSPSHSHGDYLLPTLGWGLTNVPASFYDFITCSRVNLSPGEASWWWVYWCPLHGRGCPG